jgi:Arc/MetJ-type ribon-helix-helix transcriptional regulator
VYYTDAVKTLTVRLPEHLAADIDAESRGRGVSKSDVVRERLQASRPTDSARSLDTITDVIGSVDGLPAGLSARKKRYLEATGYGRKRDR